MDDLVRADCNYREAGPQHVEGTPITHPPNPTNFRLVGSINVRCHDALSVIKTDMTVGIVRVRSLRKTTFVKRHVLDLLAASPEPMWGTYVEYSSTVACIFLKGSLTRRKRVVGELMIGTLRHLMCLPAPVTGI